MKLLLTLDYELFLGSKTGTVDRCLIKPLNSYLEAVCCYGVYFTIFVDAAYLYMLEKHKDEYDNLKLDYEKIVQHLRWLHQLGHDIQLHIHPQWYFSTFDGKEWHLDTKHYKLSDVPQDEMERLMVESKKLLDEIIGKKTIAFRAGGFSAQPTTLLTRLFKKNGLWIDSSVCPGEFYDSKYQQYNYRNVVNTGMYHFEEDICQEQKHGILVEVPLSMYRVSPLFHWRLLLVRLMTKIIKNAKHNTYGDGQSVKTTKASIFHRLFHYCSTMATIDGFKIAFLKDAIQEKVKQGEKTMCILGHPKLATPYSVEKLSEICAYVKNKGYHFSTITELLKKDCK